MAITILAAPGVVDFCLNKPAFKVGGYVAGIQKLMARIYVEPVYGSDTYSQLPDIYLDPASDYTAVFYIGKILQEYFDTIDATIYELDELKKDLYSLKRYYIKFYEWDGIDALDEEITSVYYMLYGKLAFQDWPSHTFFASLPTNKNYLNNIGTKVRCWTDSQHLIYFLNHVAGTDVLELRIVIYYTDKTTENQTIDTISSSQYDVITVPCGYAELGIASFTPGKTAYRYDIAIYTDAGAQVGKTISFYIENKPWFGKQFLLRNNYGVLEAMLCEGKEEAEVNTDFETSKKRLAYTYSATDFEYVQRVKTKTQEFKANTGPLIRSEAEHLYEMLNDKFFKIGSAGLIPCNLLSKSIKLYNEDDDLHSIEFSYQYAFEL